jgi:hypothetical protein
MEMVRVTAGFRKAKDEVAKILPPAVAAPVRELIIRMSGQLAEA